MASVFVPDLLRGQAALVTGGGSGIGAGIARALAAQGAQVALLGRRAEKLQEVAAAIVAAGGQARCYAVDVRHDDRVAEAVQDAASAFGRLDIVVNAAAGNFLAPAASLSANGFRAVVDIDLCGTFNVCRAALPHLRVRGGSIVNITAIQASVPTPLQCHAGAAKAGMAKLTRDLALEWASARIRVNAVAPGPIEHTEGMARLAPGEWAERMRARVPLGRYGSIHEVCEAVVFLCSPAAAFITGATLLVDGGTALLGAGPWLDLMAG
ncbi:MAG: SDR family oxidoreductase [Myxococcales bacterium]|nr:SDR family oxidoreductase [Myxococcota bacterium]MDW8284451.1 SDR family oxidoreductase [Myxococcales bacterium]